MELARRRDGLVSSEILVIQSTTAPTAPAGYVAHRLLLIKGVVSVHAFEMRRGTNWLDPTAAVLSHLHHWVRGHPDGPGRGIRLALPDGHPAMRCATTSLGTGPAGSSGLYVRVPDIVAVLRAAFASTMPASAVTPVAMVSWAKRSTCGLSTRRIASGCWVGSI